MNIETRNSVVYVLLFALNVIAGWAAATIAGGGFPWFDDPLNAPYKSLALALLGPITTGLMAWLMANRPKLGRAGVSEQVDELGPRLSKDILKYRADSQNIATKYNAPPVADPR